MIGSGQPRGGAGTLNGVIRVTYHARQAMGSKPSRTSPGTEGVARARLQIRAHLGWVEGFPVPDVRGDAVKWMVVASRAHPVATPLYLERRHMIAATRALGKLRGDLASGLARLVADPQQWCDRAAAMLAVLKPAIHRGSALPTSWFETPGVFRRAACDRADEICSAWPRLRPLLAAISWSRRVRVERIGRTLAWVEENALAISEFLAAAGDAGGVATAARLAFLADSDGAKRIAPLVARLGDGRVHELALGGGAEYAERVAAMFTRKRHRKRSLPARAVHPSLAAALREWVDWLVAQDRTTRRRSLALFELVMPDATLDDWQAWWRGLDRDLSRGRRVIGRRAPDPAELRKLRARFGRLQKTAPHPVHGAGLIDALRRWSHRDAVALHPVLCSALSPLPCRDHRGPLRALFLLYWTRLAAVIDEDRQARLPLLLAGFRDYLRAGGATEAGLRPWAQVYAKRSGNSICSYGIDDDLVDQLERRTDWRTFYSALRRVNKVLSDGIDRDAADSLAELVVLTRDVKKSIALFLELHRRKLTAEYVPDACLRVAVAAGGADAELVGALVDALRAQEYATERSLENTVSPLVELFRDQGVDGVIRALMLAGESRKILEGGRKLALARMAKPRSMPRPKRGPAASSLPAWARRYPTELRASLRLLCAAPGDAETAAAKILLRDFPDPGRLREQIAGVERRLSASGAAGQARLETRLATLRARLRKPRPPSQKRLDRLRGKLDRAASAAVFDDWVTRLDEVLGRSLCDYFGVREVQEWMIAPGTLATLLAVSELSGSVRSLARRVLAARGGPPPWDLREAAANRRFVASLKRRGIDPAPWIDGIGEVVRAVPGGKSVRLSLEADPVEVFAMGAHFETCLAPGAFNFFSVVANAADINKRVLYARNHRGAVVGRCLLALTANGALLTFHPYAHDGEMGFEEMVRGFAGALATRMGTVVVPSGEVPLLVASKWYDDGPIDLTGQFAFLDQDSELRGALDSIDPDAFADRLAEAFRPLALNEHTLPLVLRLSELDARPELALPLMAIADHCDGLSDEVRLRAALLAERAGASDVAQRVFGRRAVPYLLRQHRAAGWLDTDALAFLARTEPVKVLSVLRATRSRRVRSHLEEDNGDRLYYAGLASQALHRPAQALRLFERAVGMLYGADRDACRARIRGLRAARDAV